MLKFALRPEILMGSLWVVFVAIYGVVPIEYQHSPGMIAWALIASGVVGFCWGSMTITMSLEQPQMHQRATEHLDAIIIGCAIAGLCGVAFIAIDKVLLSGQDWSIGITALRDRRSVEVMEGVPIRRSWLLYAGYLTISFSCAAFCLFLLRGDRVGRIAGWFAQASVLAMVAYAVIYGGRMPILLVIVLAVSCAMVRKLTYRSLLPKGFHLWPKVLVAVAAFLAYTNAIWASRRVVGQVYAYDDFLRVAAEKWELKPSEWIDLAVRKGCIGAEWVMNFVSYAMYLTHSPTTVQRYVEHWGHLSSYLGLYQIGVLSPLFDVFAPGLKLPETMRGELARNGLYGWFPGAWGAWYLDGGEVLGLCAILAWGLLSGAAYRSVLRSGSTSSQLMLVFAYSTILISPLNGPFGMANSFLIFCSLSAVSILLKALRPNVGVYAQ